jgi:hypothetical protein
MALDFVFDFSPSLVDVPLVLCMCAGRGASNELSHVHDTDTSAMTRMASQLCIELALYSADSVMPVIALSKA